MPGEYSETTPRLQRELSLSGALLLMIGGGGLFVLLKFSHNWEWLSRDAWWMIALASALFLAWGLKLVLAGLMGRAGGTSSRFGRNRVTLPRQGQVHLAIMTTMFIGSLIGHSNMLMLVFAMMVGPFILNGWITYSMVRRTRVSRSTPEFASAGVPFAVELTLENRKFILPTCLMAVTDRVENARERLTAGVLFARVPARGKRTAAYQLRLMQRGRYRLGPVQVATRFPLGLVERGLLTDLPAEVVVFPKLGVLSPAWKRDALLPTELVTRRETRRGAFDDEFHGLREYRWGDNPRAIHWRTSARRSELMVREFHQSRDDDLLLLLDLWAPARPADVDLERVELAVSFAATVCAEHIRESRDADVAVAVAGRDSTTWEGPANPAAIEPVMKTFALAEASPDSDAARLREAAAIRRGRGVRIVAVTTRRRVGAVYPQFSEPDSTSGAAGSSNGFDDVLVVEADHDSLSKIFQVN